MALSANTWRQMRNPEPMILGNGTILTAAVVYHGSLVEWTAAGKLQGITNSTTAAFAGVAYIKTPTGTGGLTGDGSLTVDFIAGGVEILMTCNSDVTTGIVNVSAIYAQDDDTATADNTLGPVIGVCTGTVTSGSSMWIRIRGNTLARAA